MALIKTLIMDYCRLLYPDNYDQQDVLFDRICKTGIPSLRIIARVLRNSDKGVAELKDYLKTISAKNDNDKVSFIEEHIKRLEEVTNGTNYS